MVDILHTYVDFHSDFPLPEGFGDEYHVPETEEQTLGKELAECLTAGLRAKGFDVEDPEWNFTDFYIEWKLGRQSFMLNVGIDDFFDFDRWIVMTSVRSRGFFGGVDEASLEELSHLLEAVDEILKESPRVEDMRWFPCYQMRCDQDRDVGYAGPTSEVPVWEPETTLTYQAVTHYQRFCDALLPWCFSIGFVFAVMGFLAPVAGFPALTPACIAGASCLVGTLFFGIGLGVCLDAFDRLQLGASEGNVADGVVSLIFGLFIGLAFLALGVAGAVGGIAQCVRAP